MYIYIYTRIIILIVCGTINCKAHCEMTQEDVGHLPELVGEGGRAKKGRINISFRKYCGELRIHDALRVRNQT